MTDVQLTREEWLAARPGASPEFEQARFGGDVPSAEQLAIDEINPFNSHLFREDRWQEHFARLRAEDPVHFNEMGSSGRYWSITTWQDVRDAEGDWESFSSAQGITLTIPPGTPLPDDTIPFDAFIAMDPPNQTDQRKTVRGISAPSSLRNLEDLIRERTINVLDSLPEGETFDWVDTVSIELTTLMLATLFDFPLEDRRLLTKWSDLVTTIPEPGTRDVAMSRQWFRDQIMECVNYFDRLFQERRENPGFDMVSMLAHGPSTKDKSPIEHLGNLILLIVGGNDTTRNSMSGSVYALNKWPEQYNKLIADPSLISNLVPEIIRWQTPLAYMRRTATKDVEFRGKQIKKDDQVLLWYLSANRDEAVFGDNADVVDLERPNADRHLAFGHGIHFCMGARIAELQLRILWEEILPRFERIEVQAEPERTLSAFVKGYTHLPVQVRRK
jgi:cytochrome P450